MLSIILPNHNEPNAISFSKEIQALFPTAQIIISDDFESKGKGWALRQGLFHALGDMIVFIDGDGDVPARMIQRLLPFVEDFPVVVGSKRITRAPLRRKIMTHVTRIWFKFLFGLNVDTQTGIKLFRKDALQAIDNTWESDGFIHDVEILAKLHKKGFKMVEVPVEVEIKRQLSFKTIFIITGESLWLKFRLLFPAKR